MEKQELSHPQIAAELEARIIVLEAKLATVISEKDSVISEKESVIAKLTGDVEYLSFQNDQMRRLIFGFNTGVK